MINFKNQQTHFIAMGVVILIGIAVIYFSAVDPSFRSKPFDSGAWKAGDARTRGEMIDDLTRGSYLQDKSKEEVAALLGKGEERGNAFIYTIDMGVRMAYKPQPFDFALYFDRRDRWTGYEVLEPGKGPSEKEK